MKSLESQNLLTPKENSTNRFCSQYFLFWICPISKEWLSPKPNRSTQIYPPTKGNILFMLIPPLCCWSLSRTRNGMHDILVSQLYFQFAIHVNSEVKHYVVVRFCMCNVAWSHLEKINLITNCKRHQTTPPHGTVNTKNMVHNQNNTNMQLLLSFQLIP